MYLEQLFYIVFCTNNAKTEANIPPQLFLNTTIKNKFKKLTLFFYG
jgi:hypothetical protein